MRRLVLVAIGLAAALALLWLQGLAPPPVPVAVTALPASLPIRTTAGSGAPRGGVGKAAGSAALIYQSRPHMRRADRLEAIALLGDMRHGPLVALTLRSLLDDPDSSVRQQAVESLAAFGGIEAVGGLGYALSDIDDRIRVLAIEALAELGSDDATGTLALALNDPSPDVRAFAAEQLADAHSPLAAALLQRFVADDDPRVRRIATENQ